MKGLTDIPGIRVGHASDYDGITGCTAILCEGGAVAGCDIRGLATGTQEFDVMNPLHVAGRVHGVALAGGSAFGLETASGLRRWLERKGEGLKTPGGVVPIVPAAIIYDLGIGKPAHPGREMGELAASNASAEAVAEGCVGAGTGATVGKVLGMRNAFKGGLGSFTVEMQGFKVAALVVVNAAGDVVDPATGRTLAGTRTAPDSSEFAGALRTLKQHGFSSGFRQNTTLAVVATDARFDKVQATQVARMAYHGLVRSIHPVSTENDGDVVIALSLGNRSAHPDLAGIAAAEALEQAVLRAVRLAWPLGGLPGLARR